MRHLGRGYVPPEIPGYVFWSIYTSDDDAKRAILDDEGGRAYTIAKTAAYFDVPVDDVRAELFDHSMMRRRVWHGYVKDVHRAKVIYQNERLELMLMALSFKDGTALGENT